MEWIELNVYVHREAVEALQYKLDELEASGIVMEDPIDMYETKDRPYGVLPKDVDPMEDPDMIDVKAYFLSTEMKRVLRRESSNFYTRLMKRFI
ncbi:hypothetical protein G4V62_00460 [Bacillaceae bacterium SIJ1]|uniref:50S ribosomal protein L11 methyltransferase n=1 Tax=Litoribacterium kuwaitense TaxID=1398745 RepID=UPI0013ED9880|nr:50S ribosomal protein L11 methyltransferase [Litoribacterium kuwaitense]NGP43509.1 hypothetical protein [Litoribacterium kuwaitense]